MDSNTPKSPRLHRREFGFLRASANSRPVTFTDFPGFKEPINANMRNYENRMGGIRLCHRENDADAEVADECFQTFNEMLRMGEIDTDADTPHLVDPSEIQSLLEMHTGEQAEIHNGGTPDYTGVEKTQFRIWALWGAQEMANRHSMLVEEGSPLSENESPPHVDIIVNHDRRRMMEMAEVDSASDNESDLYRAGGYRRLPIGRLGRIDRREIEDLTGDQIDPKPGQLEAGNSKTGIARHTATAGSAAPEEQRIDTRDATENGVSREGKMSERRKTYHRSGGKKGGG